MKKVLFTAIALLALLPAIVSATTYYIDATGGNDGWSGTTQSTPWKTISKVNSATFNPGDQILFKRGETWREQLNVPSSGTEGKPITFGAYGSGEKPKIHNTILINKGNWTQIDRNIWKIKLSPIIKRSIIIDNERCNFVNSIGDLSKDKDVYYDNDSSYYVWNAVSPELDSRIFEWIRFYNVGRPAIFVSSKDYITFKNLSLRGGDGYHAGSFGAVSLKDCDHFTIDNCEISCSDGAGIFWYYGRDGTITNNIIYQVKRGIELGVNDDKSIIEIFNISHNYVHHSGTSSIDKGDTHGIGLFGSINNPLTIGNGIIEGNEITNGGKYGNGCQLVVYASRDVVVRYNSVHDNFCGNGIAIGNSKNIDASYNLVYNNFGGEPNWFKSGIKVSISSGGPPNVTSTSNVKVYNNIIYGNDDTVKNTSWGPLAGIHLSASTGKNLINISIKNNIVFNNYLSAGTSGHELQAFDISRFNNVVLDNNLYYRTNQPESMIYYDKKAYALNNFSTYQSQQGQDTHSIAKNPYLVNPSNNDFRLQSISPAINNGTNVGLTKDFEGKPIVGIPDIGAYEYGSASPPPSCAAADINCDTNVNVQDLAIVTSDFGKSSGYKPEADTNKDGIIDIYDVVYVASRIT